MNLRFIFLLLFVSSKDLSLQEDLSTVKKVYIILKTIERSEKYWCQTAKLPKANNAFCEAQDILQLVCLM